MRCQQREVVTRLLSRLLILIIGRAGFFYVIRKLSLRDLSYNIKNALSCKRGAARGKEDTAMQSARARRLRIRVICLNTL